MREYGTKITPVFLTADGESSVKWNSPGHFSESQGRFFLSWVAPFYTTIIFAIYK